MDSPRFSLATLSAATTLSLLLFTLPLSASAQTPQTAPVLASTEPVDVEMMQRIRAEGLNHSQVMRTVSYLTDVIGPRLTGSPGLKRANEWTRTQMAGWGLQNAHLEACGPFGRGWSVSRFSAQVTQPVNIGLIAAPKAWSPSLKNALEADVVFLDAADAAGLSKYHGALTGKIVLVSPLREITARFEPLGTRYTDEALTAIAATPLPPAGDGLRPRTVPLAQGPLPPAAAAAALRLRFAQDEGAALVIDSSRSGDGGTLFVQSATVPYPAEVPATGALRFIRRRPSPLFPGDAGVRAV